MNRKGESEDDTEVNNRIVVAHAIILWTAWLCIDLYHALGV